ncbi:MAG: sulfurtransferase-like selenium metabolism protein YedF [Defluviitaleaceae bacterium]|nr:sulfurtransferase-like selenium metabolism protein YedF [Defluviitaleaceae bacterium]
MSTSRIVDCIGDICPVPVIKTKRAFGEGGLGEFEIRVDNEVSLQNVSKFIESRGFANNWEKQDGYFAIYATVTESVSKPENPANSWVVALASDAMGADADLGRDLMKAYIFTLTQLDELPEAIVMYNRGALLVADNSPTLADLQTLEGNGVKILVCGICVKHYGLEGSVGVGEISNMYAISELFVRTQKVIKP